MCQYVPQFGAQSYMAIVDGVVRTRRTDQVLSILEVKPMSRFVKSGEEEFRSSGKKVRYNSLLT
jgi:hypothetical protein